MDFKVYKMNDYDTIISHLSKEETNKWYRSEYGYSGEEQPLNEVEELDLNQGYWSECSVEDIPEYVNLLTESEELKIKKMNGCLWYWMTFKELIEALNDKEYKEPFIACSTEW